jgi:hypothetical protein
MVHRTASTPSKEEPLLRPRIYGILKEEIPLRSESRWIWNEKVKEGLLLRGRKEKISEPTIYKQEKERRELTCLVRKVCSKLRVRAYTKKWGSRLASAKNGVQLVYCRGAIRGGFR